MPEVRLTRLPVTDLFIVFFITISSDKTIQSVLEASLRFITYKTIPLISRSTITPTTDPIITDCVDESVNNNDNKHC